MKNIWKGIVVLLLIYTFYFGFYGEVPLLPIIEQSIRNLYFHVAMWFVMMLCFIVALWYAIRSLFFSNTKNKYIVDIYSYEFTKSGLLFGTLGLVTGIIWAKYTWGQPWSNDPKQVGALIALLIYSSYFILRLSIKDVNMNIKFSSIFNIFSFAMLFPTIWILPRLVDSLHPGGEGNPAMNTNDIDANMRIVFYPAVLAWFLLGVWITTLNIRKKKIEHYLFYNRD